MPAGDLYGCRFHSDLRHSCRLSNVYSSRRKGGDRPPLAAPFPQHIFKEGQIGLSSAEQRGHREVYSKCLVVHMRTLCLLLPERCSAGEHHDSTKTRGIWQGLFCAFVPFIR